MLRLITRGLFASIVQQQAPELRAGSEIQQQADFEFGGLQIIQQLSLMHGVEISSALQFNNDGVLNQKIRPKEANRGLSKGDPHRPFSFDRQPALREHKSHRLTVDRLQETVTQFVVYLVESTNDYIGVGRVLERGVRC